jgi:RNA-binding protein 26
VEITFKDRRTAEKFFTGVQAEGIPGIDDRIELTWVGGSASGTPTPVSTPARFFKPEPATKTPAQELAAAAATAEDHDHDHDDDKDVDIVVDRPTEQAEEDYDVAEDW